MRKKIVVGNWKMNMDYWETKDLIEQLLSFTETNSLKRCSVMIAPAFPFLHYAYQTTKDTKVEVVAQNVSQFTGGAHTGEVSGQMLKSSGISKVIIGHSERRQLYRETNEIVSAKTSLAIANGFETILCVGETIEERNKGNHFETVRNQIHSALKGLEPLDIQQIIIAYEPVWAIGTGETATPDQAQEMHSYIRSSISQIHIEAVSNSISILYGGSVKPDNAQEIFSKPDVDGGLIGQASLKVKDFQRIIKALA